MKSGITLNDLAILVNKLSGSTEITVRQSISIDSAGDPNIKFGIFHKRWIYGKTAEEVFFKWKEREGIS